MLGRQWIGSTILCTIKCISEKHDVDKRFEKPFDIHTKNPDKLFARLHIVVKSTHQLPSNTARKKSQELGLIYGAQLLVIVPPIPTCQHSALIQIDVKHAMERAFFACIFTVFLKPVKITFSTDQKKRINSIYGNYTESPSKGSFQ